MAEITAFRNNALPYPVYGVPWTVVFPLLDTTGELVTGATCDSEVSLNGDTGADCTNEGTEITFTTATNKGMYYLALTAAEMTADIVSVTIHSATSAATSIVLYPRKLVNLLAGTSAGGAVGYITLPAAGGTTDDTWNGCLCVATIDTNVEARIITDYTGSTKQAAVTPSWNVAPDADDTFIIYLPEGMQRPSVDVVEWLGAAVTADTGVPEVHIVGLDADVITNAKIADDAIAAENLKTGALSADAFAADALVAATFATDSIAADALKADAVTEIVTAILAGLADGVALSDILTRLNAMAKGKITRTGDSYVFAKEDGSTASHTNVIASGGRNL